MHKRGGFTRRFCPSIRLSSETRTQNAVFSKTKQFTAVVSIDDL